VKKLAMLLALLAPLSAFATGPASPDLTSLVPDFTTVTTAILAVAGAIIGVYVAWKGAKMVIRSVKGA
jgi:protein-S-isoprenylcysteine O-methyltransferase Ste14